MYAALNRLLLAERRRELASLRELYAGTQDRARIADVQVSRFNAQWEQACASIPFYTAWRAEHRLPARIAALGELRGFPVLTKRTISERRELIARTPGIARWTLTGGTSGISTAFPMGRSDADSAWVDTHLGRDWNGIAPGDRLFMIWGHSHLFSGRGAALKHAKRRLKDRLTNIFRVSAYNLDPGQMTRIARAIARVRPRYVIGYGSCLLRFSQHAAAQGIDLRLAGIHRVVNTSESLYPEDVDVIGKVFGCPIINEYGMAEAGVIGYSQDSLYPIRVFWNDFVVRTEQRRLLISTLGRRCFPLVNYDTEDLCDDEVPVSGSLTSLSSLMGKARDVFELTDADGARHEVSVVLFDHILKQVPQLRSLHYELATSGRLTISYTTECGALDADMLRTSLTDGLRQERIRMLPSQVEFTWLEKPLQTTAGKRRTLVRTDA